MTKTFQVETLKTTKAQLAEANAKKAAAHTAWRESDHSDEAFSAWVASCRNPALDAYRVRFWNEATQEYVEGGGSSVRVAAMRAAEAAVERGWF